MKQIVLFLGVAFFLLSSHTNVFEKASKFFGTTVILNTNPTLPNTPYNYAAPSLPAHFTNTTLSSRDNEPGTNSVTDHGATLGRVLFYDVNLSIDNTVSCASCHQQASAFGDPLQVSNGISGQVTSRNSPQLTNSRYYDNGHFFWDERASTLEIQVLEPIESSIEMGEDLANLPAKLNALGYYDQLFINAFGDATITTDRMSKAMAQFVRSMVSYQSKYDAGVPAFGPITGNFANLTSDENAGKLLFEQHCDNCHKTATQIADDPFNIGLTDGNGANEDLGVGGVTGNAGDNGKFKTPSLRNIEVSGPYMHDGSIANLAAVVEHYNSGIQNHPNLHNSLKQGGQPQNLNLSSTQKTQLEDFLKTLTDNTFLTDIKFSDPFASALPVEFADFQARTHLGKYVDLEWTTATETDNEYFEIQHSIDGRNFSPIHRTESKALQTGYHYYQYRDESPAYGTNYYRIKQVDFNGMHTFSEIRNVFLNQADLMKIEVFPTTTQETLFVKVESGEQKNVTVMISDSQGRLVNDLVWQIELGTQTFELNTLDWIPGLYFVIIKDKLAMKQFRVIKK